MQLRLLIVFLVSLSSVAPAADPTPGHSVHGEAFNEGPRQAAVLIPGCGQVNLPISTQKPEAQAFFNQGVGQLHGFWYYEAERSFRQVARLDPACAMAYWGMAMANVNNEKRAKEFIRKATALKDKASAREKLWIASLETFYREDATDKRDKKQRALDYIRDLETLVQDHPEELEAKAFLAWKTWHANGDAPITSYQAVNALLDQVFSLQPQHPAHHYRIHLWDGRKPAMALKSAAQNGQAAPGIAHMWHMPGHTFSKLKRYDDAAWQQEASTRVDHAYMARNWILPDQIHNYAHNEEWLVRTYNELGRAQDAIELAKSLIRTPRHPATNTLDKESNTASYGRTRLIETLTLWERWEELLKVTDSPLIGPVVQPHHEATRLRARGLAYYAQGDRQGLDRSLKALIEVETKARAAKAKKPKEEKPQDKKSTPKGKEADKKPDPILKALNDLRALQAVLQESKTAAAMVDKATDMPKPLAASLHLRLGNKTKAGELLKNYPQDLAGLAAKTEMQQALGMTDEARKTFAEVRRLAFALDADLPVKQRLDVLAHRFGIQGEWREAAPKREDSGQRPKLESLGPLYWQPPMAPQWEAFSLDGKPVRSDSLKGKPHVLLFYLGAACSHCMKQVNAFAKAAPEYDKAGIALAAITLEPHSLAGRLAEQMTTRKLPPFPVYCDPGLSLFKSFRAYDDFEEEPLHAAVFIDAEGRLRWLDISWQPFMDTAFLLQEAQRLLKLSEPAQ